MCLACESGALESVHGLRCLIQGALYNELKDRSAAEKVCNYWYFFTFVC